jgi:hypothetical protein
MCSEIKFLNNSIKAVSEPVKGKTVTLSEYIEIKNKI